MAAAVSKNAVAAAAVRYAMLRAFSDWPLAIVWYPAACSLKCGRFAAIAKTCAAAIFAIKRVLSEKC
jgi:hypothetical protein